MRVELDMRKLLFLCGLCLYISGAAFSQTTDRERDGLKGPVKAVRVRQAAKVTEDGKETEGPLLLSHEVTYDQAGNRTELALYDGNGNLDRRVKYLYGPDGKTKVGLVTYNAQNVMIRQVFDKFGSNGFKVHATISDFNEDGTPFKRTEVSFGELGELIEVAEYQPDGTLLKKDRPAVQERNDKTADSQSTPAASDIDPVISFTGKRGQYFDLDSHGNWTRGMTGSTSSTHASGKKVSTTNWAYRELSYY